MNVILDLAHFPACYVVEYSTFIDYITILSNKITSAKCDEKKNI